MTSTSPAEHDPFFQLLSEALRAGPGSPQWGEAVAKLRDGGIDGADEYRLIIRAREDLESGRDFRRVTAGPEFTRKVLEAVEQEGGRRRGIPTATIVAILAGAVIFAVILVVLVIMIREDGKPARERNLQAVAIEKLDTIGFSTAVASGSVPGSLNGFELVKTTPATSTSSSQPISLTKLTTTKPIDPALPAHLECEIVVPAKDSAQVIELFVSDSTDPSNELRLDYSAGRARVDVAGGTPEPMNMGAPGETLKLSIRLERDVAIVEAGGRRIFAGPHGLGAAPRHAGLRLGGEIQVKSVSVAQAAPEGAR